jgi:hypothetical protein
VRRFVSKKKKKAGIRERKQARNAFA